MPFPDYDDEIEAAYAAEETAMKDKQDSGDSAEQDIHTKHVICEDGIRREFVSKEKIRQALPKKMKWGKFVANPRAEGYNEAIKDIKENLEL